jgi:hypothetical protein
MPSLVLELQRDALDPNVRVSDLLRKAVVVATKLGVVELKEWAQKELAGYEGARAVPPYRKVKGRLSAHNPYRGWIPVMIADSTLQKRLESRDSGSSISELEDLCKQPDEKGGVLHMPLPHDLLRQVFGNTREFQMGLHPTLLVGQSSVRAILDAVRNEVLRWSLALESQGILGDGMTFSAKEKEKASSVTYHIGSFSGVLGDVNNSNVQVGDFAAIYDELKKAGVPQAARNELETVLDELKSAPPEKKTSIVRRGMSWLEKYGPSIGAVSDTIRGWFEATSGS